MLALTFICIGQNQFFSACQTCQMKSDLRVMQFITQGTNYVYVQGIVTYFDFSDAEIFKDNFIYMCSWTLSKPKGPITLRNILSNLSRNAFAWQVAGELHSVTWVVSQFFVVARSVARSTAHLHFAQRIAASGNTTAQCITPPATFFASNKSACAHFPFFVPRSSGYENKPKNIASCWDRIIV